MNDDIVGRIRDFMRTIYPATATFITTITRDGRPLTRQVTGLVADDFTIEISSSIAGLKAGHVSRTPTATVLFVELTPASPARTVTVMGDAVLVTDEVRVRDFLERREAHYGVHMGYHERRSYIEITPRLLRVEKFRGDDRSRPVVIRDFETLATIEIDVPT